jgi:epoxyqueuosine reductase QueG
MARPTTKEKIKGQLKEFALKSGADLIGITSALTFPETLPGFRPTDLLKQAQSVVVMAMRIPFGSATPRPSVSYLEFGYYGLERYLNELAYKISLFLEDQGYIAMPMPGGRDILSLDIIEEEPEPKVMMKGTLDVRRAAVESGLGQLGVNNCLVTPEFGARVRLVGVLTSLELEPDRSKEWGIVPDFCHSCGFRCVKACPAKALPGNGPVDHYRCMVLRPEKVSPEKALATFRKRWSGPQLIVAAKSISYTDIAPTACATCITLCPCDRARKKDTEMRDK